MPGAKQIAAGRLVIPSTAMALSLADYLTKTWARNSLNLGVAQPFIPGFLQFCRTVNHGAAFSLGSDNGLLMTVLASLMTVFLIGWSVLREIGNGFSLFERIGMGCLLGGAMGNLIDRFSRGVVTDFLDFTFISFPIFNFADVLIDVGIGLLIIATIRKDAAKAPANSEPRLEQSK